MKNEKKYVILQYVIACDEEKLAKSGGWNEDDYHAFVNDDIGEVCETFTKEKKAYWAWNEKYSKTDFTYQDLFDDPMWYCSFYALCKCHGYDETEVMEISSGCLTLEEINA